MKRYQVNRSNFLDCGEGEPLTDFQLHWSDKDCPTTEFRAVWNDRWLAFRFQVRDDDIVLFEGADRDESVLGSDRVELFFATDAELKGSYYGIEMDPRGWVFDYRAKHYRDIDPTWRFPGLEFNAISGEGGYFVEGRVSIQVLRDHGCLNGQTMVTGVYRAEFSREDGEIQHDWISWVNPGTDKPDFHVPESFGEFVLVE